MQGVDSPCVGICKIYNGLCIGCHRTLDEIASWRDMTDAERTWVWLKIEARQSGYWRDDPQRVMARILGIPRDEKKT